MWPLGHRTMAVMSPSRWGQFQLHLSSKMSWAWMCSRHIILQAGRYVLPIHLSGTPMMMSCPAVSPLPSVTCFKSGMVLKIGGMMASEVQVKGQGPLQRSWDWIRLIFDFLYQLTFKLLQCPAHGCPFYLPVAVVELLLSRFLEEWWSLHPTTGASVSPLR